MINVLFVCWGNICRSPMAEYILKNMVEERGIADQFYIESAATSTEEIGNPVYPPARAELSRHGISCAGHQARQVVKADYEKFDYIVGMEQLHLDIMLKRFFGADPENKLVTCMSLCGRPDEKVDDPWYTGRFEEVYDQIYEACQGFLNSAGY